MGVKAKVIADSISKAGVRLTTMEVEYPRIVHAEVMTHRMFSRNAASSRAIPFNRMKEQLTGIPTRFGQANAGMQDRGDAYDALVEGRKYELNGWGEVTPAFTPEDAWEMAKEDALFWSEAFFNAGYAKQVVNRLSEPFQSIKVLISATEWDNWYWLRDDTAADPTISALAREMKSVQDASNPFSIAAGEYHLPYVERIRLADGRLIYGDFTDEGGFIEYTIEDALKVSSARSAAISFRNVNYGLEKCQQVYDRLVGDERKHSSAAEHQATPLAYLKGEGFPVGATHVDRNGNYWSGNFRGWLQFRQTIPGHNRTAEVLDVGTL